MLYLRDFPQTWFGSFHSCPFNPLLCLSIFCLDVTWYELLEGRGLWVGEVESRQSCGHQVAGEVLNHKWGPEVSWMESKNWKLVRVSVIYKILKYVHWMITLVSIRRYLGTKKWDQKGMDCLKKNYRNMRCHKWFSWPVSFNFKIFKKVLYLYFFPINTCF